MKEDFLLKELWFLSVSAAFQRANVYVEKANETQRADFKKALFSEVYKISEQYKSNNSEKQHIENIKSVIEFSKKTSQILQNGALSFGVAQKLLNLFLKYLWCLGKISVPPHFPVDRIIQYRLGIKEKDIVSWTKDIKSEQDYLPIIEKAREVLKQTNITSIAELELEIYKDNTLSKLVRKD